MLNKVDTPAGRKGRLSGEKHWKVEQKDLNAVGGRSAFVAQAEALEAEGLIRVKWYDVDHTDAEIVHFRLENLSELYRRAGKTPPWEKIAVLRNELEKRRGSRKKSWKDVYKRQRLRHTGNRRPENPILKGLNWQKKRPAWRSKACGGSIL